MEITDNAAGAGPAPAEQNDASSTNSQPAEKGVLNTREVLRDRLAKREAAEKTSAVPPEKGDDTESTKVAPKEDAVGEKAEKVSAKPSRAERRIEQLTQRYYNAEQKAARAQAESEKLHVAVKMMQEEIDRLHAKAQDRLDPREEQLVEMRRKQEVEQYLAKSANKDTELLSNATQEWEVEQRVADLIDEVGTLAEEYYLTSPEEILLKMKATGGTATETARALHNSRLTRAGKSTAPSHPKTVSATGTPSTDAVRQPHSRERAADFFRRRMAERNGRAE
jgi:hypothetical protein